MSLFALFQIRKGTRIIAAEAGSAHSSGDSSVQLADDELDTLTKNADAEADKEEDDEEGAEDDAEEAEEEEA